jgi:hypothetical protein
MNAAVASDTLRFFLGICVFSLDAVAIRLALFLFNRKPNTVEVLHKWLEFRNPSFCLIQEQLSRWLVTGRNRTSS